MASPRALANAHRVAERIHRTLGEEALRLREDAGIPRTTLATAAGVDEAYLRRIEDGRARPSLETYARLGTAIGADLAAHLYPNAGPAIRDRHQARIAEQLLLELHSRWRPYQEVAVRQPARGWIDVVLHEPRDGLLVAVEIQSALPRLEQLLRWSQQKASSLTSWDGFAHLGPISATSNLLVVRSTRATRSVGSEFARQLQSAYPAHPQDAMSALTGIHPWPGAAVLWVDVRTNAVRFIGHR
jgi:transcriptional regulator with XRE-family HTH domain